MNTLILGDCLKKMGEMADNSVDGIITDPPYGLSSEPDIAEVLQHWLAGDNYEHGSSGFMGKSWDSFVPGPEYWRECARVLKPGGYLMAFSSTRTFDLLSIAIRFSGLEIRDCISHIYASGFPKSHNLSMGIDALKWSEAKDELIKQYPGKTEEEIKEIAGFKREVVGKKYRISNIERGDSNIEQQKYESRELDFTSKSENSFVTKGATSEAAQFDGYGTALKPACEKVLVFRKKFKGTVAQNALEHGTGGINIDACRVESGGDDNKTKGRWPANVAFTHSPECVYLGKKKIKGTPNKDLSSTKNWGRESLRNKKMWVGSDKETVDSWNCAEGCPVKELAEQSGECSGGSGPRTSEIKDSDIRINNSKKRITYNFIPNDTGTAARYFPVFRYQSKPSQAERNAGLGKYITETKKYGSKFDKFMAVYEESLKKNPHPTVKSKELLKWLAKLIVPPISKPVILDPFMGSGSMGIACHELNIDFIGIEKDTEYFEIAKKRIEFAESLMVQEELWN